MCLDGLQIRDAVEEHLQSRCFFERKHALLSVYESHWMSGIADDDCPCFPQSIVWITSIQCKKLHIRCRFDLQLLANQVISRRYTGQSMDRWMKLFDDIQRVSKR